MLQDLVHVLKRSLPWGSSSRRGAVLCIAQPGMWGPVSDGEGSDVRNQIVALRQGGFLSPLEGCIGFASSRHGVQPPSENHGVPHLRMLLQSLFLKNLPAGCSVPPWVSFDCILGTWCGKPGICWCPLQCQSQGMGQQGCGLLVFAGGCSPVINIVRLEAGIFAHWGKGR